MNFNPFIDRYFIPAALVVFWLALPSLIFAEEPVAEEPVAEKPVADEPSPAVQENKSGPRPFSCLEFELAEPYETKVTIVFVDAPDRIQRWAADKLIPVFREWRPKLEQMLKTEGYTAPKVCTIVFVPGDRGVAYTSGTKIVCFWSWFEKNLDGEAMGAFVHELTHWVQQYPSGNPGWLVEGVTDYIRWYQFEPKPVVHINFRRANYTDSYRTTAAFLDYLIRHGFPTIIDDLNAAMRSGTYSNDFWTQKMGKSAEQLWSEFRDFEMQKRLL